MLTTNLFFKKRQSSTRGALGKLQISLLCIVLRFLTMSNLIKQGVG